MTKLLHSIGLLVLLCCVALSSQAQDTRKSQPWRFIALDSLSGNVGLSVSGFAAQLTYGTIWRNGVQPHGEPVPGYACELFYRRKFLSTSTTNHLFAELGFGYNTSRGAWILGQSIPGPGDRRETLGRYPNRGIVFPVKVGYHFWARNSSWQVLLGVDGVTLPKFMNPNLPAWHRWASPHDKKYNISSVVEAGICFPKVKLLDSISLQYRKARWELAADRKRTIGIVLKLTV